MITHFQKVIHRHGRWIFLILLGFIIVAFVLMDYAGGMGSRSRRSDQDFKTILGKRVNPRELEVAKRLQEMKLMMQYGRELQNNPQALSMLRQRVEELALKQMALVEKAKALGLTVTEEEFLNEGRRFFADKQGQFDKVAYARFVTEYLTPRRISEDDLGTFIREQLLIRKVADLIQSTAKVSPKEVSDECVSKSEKISAAACRFEFTDFMAQIKPTAEELTKYYNEHQDRFRTPDKVKVEYVAFPVDTKAKFSEQELKQIYEENKSFFQTSDGKVKPLAEVMDVLRLKAASDKARTQADELTVKLVPEEGKQTPSFEAAAKQAGVTVKQTGFFAQNALVPGIKSFDFVAAAFRLSKEVPVSDPIVSDEAMYVIHFLDQENGSVPPFEKVKDAVTTSVMTERSIKLARETGEKKRQELQAAIAGGKTFDQAVQALKLKSVKLKAFAQLDPPASDPFENSAEGAAIKVPTGALGDFIPNSSGGFFVYVASREKAKPEEVLKIQAQVQQDLTQRRQMQVMNDFQEVVFEEAKLEKPKKLSLGGESPIEEN